MTQVEKIILNAQAALLAIQEAPHTYLCRFVRAGRVNGGAGKVAEIEITPQALHNAVSEGLFEGRAVFVDHASFFEYPSLHDLVGVTSQAISIDQGQEVNGQIRFYETPQTQPILALLQETLADRQAGLAVPDIGLSLVFFPLWEEPQKTAELRRIVGIQQIESIDLVFQPAADGRLLHSLSAQPSILVSKGVHCMNSDEEKQNYPYPLSVEHSCDDEEANGDNERESEKAHSTDVVTQTPQTWSQALSESAAAFMIANSGLPQAARDKLAALTYQTPTQVVNAIEAERKYLANLTNEQVVQIGGTPPRSASINFGGSGLEQISLALEALIKGIRPAQGVQPLSGIRELYNLLSGDFEMTGLFHPERVYLANVNSSTMANLVADVLNKVLVQEFQEYPQWWQPFVTQMDFGSLQSVRWVTLGGVGELPTVAEGAAYTELSWGDRYETAPFIKKGGYLGITIEAIDKDDTARLRAAPRALAQAAWLTLGKTISSIFTANNGSGPTLSDGINLFHNSHSNLGGTALSLSAWVAARIAMRKQSELNSGERLGFLTAPRFLLVPPDLEVTGLQILASSHDYSYAMSNGVGPAPSNVFSEGETADMRLRSARERVVVVDLWSDSGDWAAVADPRLYPSIGLGFRYGRTPEIYSVSSPTAGLMFSNDVMPVKVRFFYAVGAVDYRGLYKSNVA